jgi:hypothetical protein
VESAVAKISICASVHLPAASSSLLLHRLVSIVNSQNLTLHLRGRILTSTVEAFKCRNIRLIIGRSDQDNSADEVQPLGTLQLDPPLENVTIEYAAPQHVGKMILAPLATRDGAGRPTFGFSSLSVRANTTDAPTILFDGDGVLHFPTPAAGERAVTIAPGVGGLDMARQLVVSHNEEQGWRITGLERGEKDYPVMA